MYGVSELPLCPDYLIKSLVLGYNIIMEKESKKKNDLKAGACCSLPKEPEEVDPYTCPYCKERFHNPVEVIQHVFRVHVT